MSQFPSLPTSPKFPNDRQNRGRADTRGGVGCWWIWQQWWYRVWLSRTVWPQGMASGWQCRRPLRSWAEVCLWRSGCRSRRDQLALKLVVSGVAKEPSSPAEHRFLYEGIEKKGPDDWNTTYYPKAADHVNLEKQWYIVDAADKRLGRLVSAIAVHIRGKNLATFTPSIDMGAYVVVINAEKIGVIGKKFSLKLYRRHSGRPGGMKEETFGQLQTRIPERIVEHAVPGMLPKGRLGRRLFTHWKVYTGSEHPHIAQKLLPLPIADPRIAMKA